MPERRWTDADRELVAAALPADPDDPGSTIVGWELERDLGESEPSDYYVPRLGDPRDVAAAVLDALTVAGWRKVIEPCDCSCHRCCVPPDVSCVDCRDDHG